MLLIRKVNEPLNENGVFFGCWGVCRGMCVGAHLKQLKLSIKMLPNVGGVTYTDFCIAVSLYVWFLNVENL